MARQTSNRLERSNLIFTEEERIKAIQEIESGQLTFQQTMLKYKILDKETLRYWIIKHAQDPQMELKKKLTQVDRRKAAFQVIYKEATVSEVAAQMRVSPHSIRLWVRKFKNEANISTKTEDNILQSDQQGEIQQLKLKIAALETMIDIAEQELKIEIRKKSGTKQ